MLDTIASIMGTSGLGAIVGAIGSWVQKREDRKMKQLEFSHEIQKTELLIKETQLENEQALALADKEIDKAETEGKIQQDIGELSAFTESIKAGFKETGNKFVDSIRGIMRPAITSYLLLVSTIVAVQISALVGGLETLSMIQLISMYEGIINDIMFLTMVAVTWWFGTRPHTKQAR